MTKETSNQTTFQIKALLTFVRSRLVGESAMVVAFAKVMVLMTDDAEFGSVMVN
jgi:hypothetical protein